MDINELVNRSKIREKIKFDEIGCLNQDDPLVEVPSEGKILVVPIWEFDLNDIEGKLYAEYIKANPLYKGVYIRSTLKDMLVKASHALPGSYSLVIHAGHRPLAVQRKLLNDLKNDYLKSNPGTSDDEALEHARTYVSDPDIKRPPHCCGAAVDVEIYDNDTGEYLDFGAPVNTDSEISYLHSDLINEKQRNNRLLLLETMLSAGFGSIFTEWWHFGYGDQNWAWFYKQNNSLYGIIEPEL